MPLKCNGYFHGDGIRINDGLKNKNYSGVGNTFQTPISRDWLFIEESILK